MNYNTETELFESAVFSLVCAKNASLDVNEEISIPEGLPDVRRTLALKENILSPAKFIGARSVELSGAIDYTVIYLGADGKIYSIPFSAEYSFSIPVDNADNIALSEGACLLSSLYGASHNVRITSPRRLQIRSGLCAQVLCFASTACEEELRGIAGEESLQRLVAKGNSLKISCDSSEVVTLADEFALGESCRILYSDASVSLGESRVDGEIVRVNGEVSVKLAVESQEKIEKITRKIPFEAQIDIEELDFDGSAALCRAVGRVNELDVSLIEEGRAQIEVGLVIDASVAQNAVFSYTKDIYSTCRECSAEYKKISSPLALVNKNAGLTQSERVLCSELGFLEGSEIIDVWGSAICESGTLENGRYVIRGRVRYKLLCEREGEISAYDAELPFKYEAGSGELEPVAFCACIEVNGARARCDGENLLIESELSISLSMFGASEYEILSVASFGDEIKREKNQIVVCFKSPDEGIFEIGKRYCVPLESISENEENQSFVIIER